MDFSNVNACSANPARWCLEFWGGRTYDEGLLLLYRVEPYKGRGEWPDGITEDVIAFILRSGVCAYCRRSFSAPLCACVCGKAFWDNLGCEIAVAYSRKAHKTAIDRLLARQRGRAGRLRRAALEKVAEGSRLTRVEKACLYQAQGGLCYYCGDLMSQSGPGKYHHDHFVPLALGGRADLENAVLACGSCNLRKSNLPGMQFVKRMRRLKVAENPSQLAQMRRAFARWRRERGFRALADLPVGS